MKDTLKNLIKSAIDLHVHIGPEIIPRKFSVKTLISKEKGKIAGMALKNHFYPTSPLIKTINPPKHLKLIGSVTLNNYVGGLNPDAIYANSLISSLPIIVWLPTINARQFLDESEFEIPNEWVQKKSFQARKSATVKPVSLSNIKRALKTIQMTNSILATGHISWRQSRRIVAQAIALGINKVIITHPIYQRINMPIRFQLQLSKTGAYIEHCYSMYLIDKIPISKITLQIQAVGSQYCILSSDVGQVFSPSPSTALYRFAKLLLKAGISEKQLETMLVTNPNKLIEKS